MVDVDSFIDSESFNENELLYIAENSNTLTLTSLIRYLSKGVVAPIAHSFSPKASVVEKLLQKGAVPFSQSSANWLSNFESDIRHALPIPLRSTINLATLIDDSQIVRLLVMSGEQPNKYTYKLVNSVSVVKELLTTKILPSDEDFNYLMGNLKTASKNRIASSVGILKQYIEANKEIEKSSVDRFLDFINADFSISITK